MLAEFQRQFLRAVYDGKPISAAQLQANALGRSAEHCLMAYSDSVQATLCKALAEIYPVARQFVGERFFDALAMRYVQQHPSEVTRLDDYGETFSDFCAGFEPVQQVPHLPALLALEWAWHRAFHSADSQAFDFAAFAVAAEQQAGRLRFVLSDQLSLVAAGFRVDQLWLCHQPQWPDGQLPDLEAPVQLVIHRPGREVFIEPVDAEEFSMLEHLLADPGLEGLCDLLGENVAVLLPRAIEHGWICGFELENDEYAGTDQSA